MPSYWFKNKKTKKFTLESMTISEMEKYLKKNKNMERAIYKTVIIEAFSNILCSVYLNSVGPELVCIS